MRPQHIMFLGFIMFIGIVISLTFAGGWFSSTDLGVMNSLAGFKSAKILGIWSIMVPNIDFITIGLGALVKMDFAFFGGTMGLLRWFFICVIGSATVWGIFTVVINTISGLWRR